VILLYQGIFSIKTETMKEDVIEFNTAVLAKDKGHEEMCKSWYAPNGDFFENSGGFSDNSGRMRTSAPTQTLLAKWLLKNYNIFVHAQSSTKNGDKWIDWYVSVNNKQIIDHRDGLETMEEAFEVGLIEGLKLIKLVDPSLQTR